MREDVLDCNGVGEERHGIGVRMINILDLSAGVAGTKLLIDNPNRDDGSPAQTSQPGAVKRAICPISVEIEDEIVHSAGRMHSPLKQNVGGTPIKTLIAREMSREVEFRHKPPGVVAKLMGLDSLPAQQQILNSGNSQESSSRGDRGGHDLRDVYEVYQQPSKMNRTRNQSLKKSRADEKHDDGRMAFVHQKFMEAKRLATNEKLLQSKEFQDALEVLSSNRDIFLKFLEEPNSLFRKQLNELQTIAPTSQTKHITVLKPIKNDDIRLGKQIRREVSCGQSENVCRSHRSSSYTSTKSQARHQTTRIVVLKPGPANAHDLMTSVASPVSSPKNLEIDEIIRSSDVSRDITRQWTDNLIGTHRDESVLSSILSNGYVGDDSSFNRSENEYMEEGCANLSDSEVMTPTSQHSWEFITNRFGSPCSFSSISQASYSPESSVIKEAKKRLSERWALVASNGLNQERRQVQRSSSTLAEMLLIPKVKRDEETDGAFMVSSNELSAEDDPSVASSSNDIPIKDSSNEISPRNLLCSLSVPVSSYADSDLNVRVSDFSVSKTAVSDDSTRKKKVKSSFRGKVLNLFFSRIKKPDRDKASASPLATTREREGQISISIVQSNSDLLKKSAIGPLKESFVDTMAKNYDDTSCSFDDRLKLNLSARERYSCLREVLSTEKTFILKNSSDGHIHHCPDSVLQAPFQNETRSNKIWNYQSINYDHPRKGCESTASTLSRNEPRIGISLQKDSKLSRLFSKADDEEKEHERLVLVQKLLSLSGLANESTCSIFLKWHSPDRPLDPTLLDKFLDRKEEEAKCRERRSNQRLLFDCVNTALLNIGQAAMLTVHPRAMWNKVTKDTPFGAPVLDEVNRMITISFSNVERYAASEAVLDWVVRRDINGNEWIESVWYEVDAIGSEIGGQVLEDLVGEALQDLIGRCIFPQGYPSIF